MRRNRTNKSDRLLKYVRNPENWSDVRVFDHYQRRSIGLIRRGIEKVAMSEDAIMSRRADMVR